MTAVGPVNGESDGAADRLLARCRPLLEEIEAAMGESADPDPDDWYDDWCEWDEYGGIPVDADAGPEVIARLTEALGRYRQGLIQDTHYPHTLRAPPPAETVAGWQWRFLAAWDAEAGEPNADPEVARWRECVVEWFEWAEWKAGGEPDAVW